MSDKLLEEARDVIYAEVMARGDTCNITHIYETLPTTHPELVHALGERFDPIPYWSWRTYVAREARRVIDQSGDYWYDKNVRAWRRGPKP